MATMDEYKSAAKKKPRDRSGHEQSLVDKGSNMQEIRNLDFDARERQRREG